MADFVVKNLTDSPVILPTPVSRVLKGRESVNLGEESKPDHVRAIKSVLNALEQAGVISVEGVADTLSAIDAAAEKSGDIHPLFKKALNAQQEFIQFNHRAEVLSVLAGGAAGGAGVECWVMITDSDGTPDLLADTASITVAISGSGKIDGVSTSKVISMVQGIGKFTVTDAVAETVTLSLSGTPPNNVVFGSPLIMTDTQDVQFV